MLIAPIQLKYELSKVSWQLCPQYFCACDLNQACVLRYDKPQSQNRYHHQGKGNLFLHPSIALAP